MPDDPRDRPDTLAETIRRSRVLDPEVTPRFELLSSQIHDPDGLAREMVTRQWLTSYQASRLLDGLVDDLVLGPYVLLDLLGEGGMGRVYKARHRLMNRVVALKVIRADLLDRIFVLVPEAVDDEVEHDADGSACLGVTG